MASPRLNTFFCAAALLLTLAATAPAQDTAPSATQPATTSSSSLAATSTAPAATSSPIAPPAPQAQSAPPQVAAPSTDATPASPTQDQTQSAQQPESAPTQAPLKVTKADGKPQIEAGEGISEDELKQMLIGKELYLRGGYLDNSLSFDEHGRVTGHSTQGSYTLSAIEIDKVHLTKHKVELEGVRYGLHFANQLAYDYEAKAVDRVRITPKKKVVKITIDREMVVTPKKQKTAAAEKKKGKKVQPAAEATSTPPPAMSASATAKEPAASATPQPASAPPATTLASTDTTELSEADQLKASIAAAPESERPADPKSVTTTISAAHATKTLKDALDVIFAQGLDDRMMAAMPDFWKLYYQAAAAKVDYRPSDPSILRQNMVDQKARLLSTFEPDSNEFAQENGVAGMALYHTVIGVDGKAGEIAVGRPIGFGLDENAVAAIRKASFQPAIKDGKPVPVLLDLVVQFRIFSKRTAVVSPPEPADKPAEPVLPGPYSLSH